MISDVNEKASIDWGNDTDPSDWRNMPDPEEQYEEDIENDSEDVPTPQFVKDILGFDPDEFKEETRSS